MQINLEWEPSRDVGYVDRIPDFLMQQSIRLSSPIRFWREWLRKGHTIRSVSESLPASEMASSDYRDRMATVHRTALQSLDPLAKTRCFWKMEKLSAEFVKTAPEGIHLGSINLDQEIRPIAHCGMGIGAVEHLSFERERLLNRLDQFSEPGFRLFAYESIGAMLAVYEPGPFLHLARTGHRLGLIPLAPIQSPGTSSYLQTFPGELCPLLSHGYGRIIYFRSASLRTALRAARSAPRSLDFFSLIRGIAFAMAMVNAADLSRVLLHDFRFLDPTIHQAFEDGLVYALVFWEWMSPGFLDLYFRGKETCRLERARREIALSRSQERPLAFALHHSGSDPR